jgi:hypothetical protein
MTEHIGEWLLFDHNQPKRKRAELVCSACHGKKIKCDLQSKKDSPGDGKCTNCRAGGRECRIRPSKRRRNANNGVQQARPPPSPSSADETRTESVVSHPQSSASNLPPRDSPRCQRDSGLQASKPPIALHTSRSSPTDVDTGFLQIYGPENQYDAQQQEMKATVDRDHNLSGPRQLELLQIFAETYIDYVYPWCPVLDVSTILEDCLRSPLLANAMALAASHIRPPLIPHEGPANYYDKARTMFYNDEEADGVTTLQAVSLFYWWAPRPPTVAHRHSSWWWTSVLIRHAQQMNFHREPTPPQPALVGAVLSLRRRIWWTAFARERLTALCQSKPSIIDPLDCNIQEPTLADFPPEPRMQRKGEIFIAWVRLCGIIGDIAKSLSRSKMDQKSPFPTHLWQKLVDWVQSLPPHLQLPIGSQTTMTFDRDVHQLYLPYLTTIVILHLKRSAQSLPQALPPAILAASCIARILRDILSRGDTRFLMAITCWYSGTAFIALLQASRIEGLCKEANADLDVLTNAAKQLQRMWGSANILCQGFDRLRSQSGPASGDKPCQSLNEVSRPANSNVGDDASTVDGTDRDLENSDEFDWTALFPTVTKATNGIAAALLPGREPGASRTRFPSPENTLFHETLMTEYQDLFEPFAQFDPLDFLNLGLAE